MSISSSELKNNIAMVKESSINDSIKLESIKPGMTLKPRKLDGLAKNILLKQFALITLGELYLKDGDNSYHFGCKSDECDLSVTIDVQDSRFYADVCFGGSIGASEAYMYGYWTTDNLTDLIRIFSKNSEALDTIEGGLAYITVQFRKSCIGLIAIRSKAVVNILLRTMILVMIYSKSCLMKQ